MFNNGSDTKINESEDSITNSNEGYPIGDELYDETDDEKILHGYDKISNGCAQKIQLENPDKKEALVCFFVGFLQRDNYPTDTGERQLNDTNGER